MKAVLIKRTAFFFLKTILTFLHNILLNLFKTRVYSTSESTFQPNFKR
jgi:hypothetical protein